MQLDRNTPTPSIDLLAMLAAHWDAREESDECQAMLWLLSHSPAATELTKLSAKAAEIDIDGICAPLSILDLTEQLDRLLASPDLSVAAVLDPDGMMGVDAEALVRLALVRLRKAQGEPEALTLAIRRLIDHVAAEELCSPDTSRSTADALRRLADSIAPDWRFR